MICSGYWNDHELLGWQQYLQGQHDGALVLAHIQAEQQLRQRSQVVFPGDEPFDVGQLSQLDTVPKQWCYLKQYRQPGRMPVPKQPQQLWAQHKYSVMARSVPRYQQLGKHLARPGQVDELALLAELTDILYSKPEAGGLYNALLHMWGYVKLHDGDVVVPPEKESMTGLIQQIQHLSMLKGVDYLTQSSALSELAVWLPSVLLRDTR